MQLRPVRLSDKKFFFLLLAAAAVRLLFTAFQRVTLLPDESILDDYLVYEAAKNVAAGNWLGAYSFMTIGKHMLFSVWLALLHTAGIPYLLAGQLLFVSGCVMLALAFSPVMKARIYQLVFFAFLVFSPVSYADFTLRVYRDNITTSLFLIVFASVVGFALRAGQKRLRSLWLYGVSGGLSLGAAFLLREDGFWLIPFAAAGVLIILILILKNREHKRLPRIAALGLTAVLPVCCMLVYCLLNHIHYGRFIVSDLTSKEFYDACGAMTRVVIPEGERNPIVPLPYSSRRALYDACPSFRELEPYLESEHFSRMRKDVGNGVMEYSGGGYYWAVRNAASLAGYYESAETARVYFERLAAEINAACDSGAVPASKKRSGLNAPITFDRIAPTLAETGSELLSVLFYTGIECSPAPSTGSRYEIAEMERFLSAKALTLQQTFSGDALAVVTAYSETGPVGVSLIDQSENPYPAEITPATGGDRYIQRLLSTGNDLLHVNGLRKYVSFSGTADSCRLRLSDGEDTVTVPLQVTEGAVAEGGMIYTVEYVGADYTETDTASYGFLEIWSYRAMRVAVWVYRLLNPLLIFTGLAAFLRGAAILLRLRKKKSRIGQKTAALSLICLGLPLTALLRLGMMAFAETSAFGIGTYPMYFSVAHLLFIAFSFASIRCFLSLREKGA